MHIKIVPEAFDSLIKTCVLLCLRDLIGGGGETYQRPKRWKRCAPQHGETFARSYKSMKGTHVPNALVALGEYIGEE